MKLKLIYPLAVVLAAALAATGCHNHATGKVTPLPGQNQGVVGGDNGGGTIQPDVNATVEDKRLILAPEIIQKIIRCWPLTLYISLTTALPSGRAKAPICNRLLLP